jgi:hypothetical protein
MLATLSSSTGYPIKDFKLPYLSQEESTAARRFQEASPPWRMCVVYLPLVMELGRRLSRLLEVDVSDLGEVGERAP